MSRHMVDSHKTEIVNMIGRPVAGSVTSQIDSHKPEIVNVIGRPVVG